jgi:hypothetical protein
MAQLIWWLDGGWAGAQEMAPGDVHYWVAWGGGLKFDDVITLMAHPVLGDPNAQERVLQVENVKAEGTSDGTRRIYYSVRNVGQEWIPGYGLTGMLLRPQ